MERALEAIVLEMEALGQVGHVTDRPSSATGGDIRGAGLSVRFRRQKYTGYNM